MFARSKILVYSVDNIFSSHAVHHTYVHVIEMVVASAPYGYRDGFYCFRLRIAYDIGKRTWTKSQSRLHSKNPLRNRQQNDGNNAVIEIRENCCDASIAGRTVKYIIYKVDTFAQQLNVF